MVLMWALNDDGHFIMANIKLVCTWLLAPHHCNRLILHGIHSNNMFLLTAQPYWDFS